MKDSKSCCAYVCHIRRKTQLTRTLNKPSPVSFGVWPLCLFLYFFVSPSGRSISVSRAPHEDAMDGKVCCSYLSLNIAIEMVRVELLLSGGYTRVVAGARRTGVRDRVGWRRCLIWEGYKIGSQSSYAHGQGKENEAREGHGMMHHMHCIRETRSTRSLSVVLRALTLSQ